MSSLVVGVGDSFGGPPGFNQSIEWTHHPDGTPPTWQAVTTGIPGLDGSTIEGVGCDGHSPTSTFVLTGDGHIATSNDALLWTDRTAFPSSDILPQSAFWVEALGLWLAGGIGTGGSPRVVLTSPDGVTWTARTTPWDASSSQVNAFAYSATLGLIAAVGFSETTGNPVVMTSPDGTTWTSRTTSFDGGGQLFAVAEDGAGHFLAVGADSGGTNVLLASSDGATWTAVPDAWTGSKTGRGVAWNGSLWVVVGSGSTAAQTSPDGSTWTQQTTPWDSSGGLLCVLWDATAGVWCAGGTGDPTFNSPNGTSPDGITWTPRDTSGDVTAGGRCFAIAIGVAPPLVVQPRSGIVETFGAPARVPTTPIPAGLDAPYRVVAWDATIGDEGVSHLSLTLNIPPPTKPGVPAQLYLMQLLTDLQNQVQQLGTQVSTSTGKAYATVVVAANNSRLQGADFICAGFSDEATINEAVATLPPEGGKVLLLEGDYNTAKPVVLSGPAIVLEGMGASATVIRGLEAGTADDDYDLLALEGPSAATIRALTLEPHASVARAGKPLAAIHATTIDEDVFAGGPVFLAGTGPGDFTPVFVESTSEGGVWTQVPSAANGAEVNSLLFDGRAAFGTVPFFEHGTRGLYRTLDGETWDFISTPMDGVGVNSIGFGNGLYVATSFDSDPTNMISTDGINWTDVTNGSLLPGGDQWGNPVFGAGVWLLPATGYHQPGIYSSPDAINWTLLVTGTPLDTNGAWSIAWNGEFFVAVGGFTGGAGEAIATSPDGITWTPITSPWDALRLYQVIWDAERRQWIAVGDFATVGNVGTSPDGITWTERPTPTVPSGESVAVVATGPEHIIAAGPPLNFGGGIGPGPVFALRSKDGGATWEDISTAFNGPATGAVGALLFLPGVASDLRIEDVSFTGGPTDGSFAYPVMVDPDSPMRLDIGNCDFHGPGVGPVRTDDGFESRVLGNRFDRTTGGVEIRGPTGSTDNTIGLNTFLDVTGEQVLVTGTVTDTAIEDNVFAGVVPGPAIQLELGASACNVENNTSRLGAVPHIVIADSACVDNFVHENDCYQGTITDLGTGTELHANRTALGIQEPWSFGTVVPGTAVLTAQGSTATSPGAVAGGQGTTASGQASDAWGEGSQALGRDSAARGSFGVAYADAMDALGGIPEFVGPFYRAQTSRVVLANVNNQPLQPVNGAVAGLAFDTFQGARVRGTIIGRARDQTATAFFALDVQVEPVFDPPVSRAADGSTWALATDFNGGTGAVQDLSTDGVGTILALMQNTGTAFVSTDHGDTWTALPGMPDALLRDAVWDATDSQWVAIDQGFGTTKVWTTPDLVTWTGHTTPLNEGGNGVAVGGSVLVAIGTLHTGGHFYTGTIIRSTDAGATWGLAVTNPWATNFNVNADCIFYGAGVFLAGGQSASGGVLSSTDGDTWTQRSTPTLDEVLAFAYSSSLGLYVGVGWNRGSGASIIVTSPDGVTWTPQTVPNVAVLTDVQWDDTLALFVAVGTDNITLSSPDGVTWTQDVNPTAIVNARSVTSDGTDFILGGQGPGTFTFGFVSAPPGVVRISGGPITAAWTVAASLMAPNLLQLIPSAGPMPIDWVAALIVDEGA